MAAHDNDFHAIATIEMDVLGAHNKIAKIVLHARQIIYRSALMVVVNSAVPYGIVKTRLMRVFILGLAASDRRRKAKASKLPSQFVEPYGSKHASARCH